MQWLRRPTATQPSTGVVTGAAVCERWRHTKRMMAPERASLSLSCSTPLPSRSCPHQAAVRLLLHCGRSAGLAAVDTDPEVVSMLLWAQQAGNLQAMVSACMQTQPVARKCNQTDTEGWS